MPELPEVETIRRGLEKYVAGLTIKDIEIRHPKPFQGSAEQIVGSKVLSARRIGKGLILDLSNGYSLAIHVKMTGQLVFRSKETEREELSSKVGSLPNKYTHVIFKFKNQNLKVKSKSENSKDFSSVLYYNDMRRFGWIRVVKTSEVLNSSFFKQIGPEPLKDLTFEKFKTLISRFPTKIKILIMDQSKIGGIGNIYANDALFEAKINPERPAKSLNKDETKNLFDAINSVLNKGIEVGGSSERSYVNVLGQEGSYQKISKIYGKTGKPCPRHDGGLIKRITLGGRGTFFCEKCQV